MLLLRTPSPDLVQCTTHRQHHKYLNTRHARAHTGDTAHVTYTVNTCMYMPTAYAHPIHASALMQVTPPPPPPPQCASYYFIPCIDFTYNTHKSFPQTRRSHNVVRLVQNDHRSPHIHTMHLPGLSERTEWTM